jgi:hypothetical protein
MMAAVSESTMRDDTHQAEIVRAFARRRRLAYAGLWLVAIEILAVLAMSRLDAAFSGFWLWALLLGPAAGYLLFLWRTCRCPVCGTPLLLDAGPYQRVVFNLNARTCPHCGATLV